MKRAGACFLTAAFLMPGAVVAQGEHAVPAMAPSPAAGDEQPRPVIRMPVYAAAAAAAAGTRRMSIEQREERGFLRNVAAASRFEAEAARIAVGKSANATVRSFATSLLNHHTSATPVLQHMLHARGMAAPMLENAHRKVLNRLAKVDGAKFDREFMATVGLKYQAEEVQVFERAQKVVKDPVLAAWIEKTLVARRDTLAIAEQATNGDVKMVRGTSFARAARQAAPATVPGMALAPATPQTGTGSRP